MDDSNDGTNDEDNNNGDGLSHHRSGVGVHKLNDDVATDKQTSNYNREKDDDYFSNIGNTMSLTDAAVSKFSFIERLTYYMDGEHISMTNCKSVEICIMIQCGRYVHNIDPMRRKRQEEIILCKYTSVINGIKAMQFASDSVQAAMLLMYSGGKKHLTGPTLWRQMEKVMSDTKIFGPKFPGVKSASDLPSGLT